MNQKIPKNITSIIFDLGGVLFDIDYSYTQRAFMALGAKEFNKLYSQQKQEGIFDEFEKGKVSASYFRAEVKRFLPSNTSEKQIDEAWNALLIGFPAEKIRLLERLKKQYRLFLLSNTNDIHLPAVLDMIDNAHGDGIMAKLFEKEYYSCRMGMRKPDMEIFETVCVENKLDISSTLFIDDSIQNIEGARKFGLYSLHYNSSISLEEYFN
jgi:FMN phosphatase YigB (HAD superfamily)